jgi:hypothetical protein
MFDVIASAQNGLCYLSFARRYGIDEVQAEEATYFLVKSLLPALDAWISKPEGMSQFLASLSRDGYERILLDPQAFSDRILRDRGAHLIAVLSALAPPDPECVRSAELASGLPIDTLGRMLPHVGVLMMAAIRTKADAPLREILARLRGSNAYAASVRDPFAALQAVLSGESRQQGPVRRLLGGLLGRDPVLKPARVAQAG